MRYGKTAILLLLGGVMGALYAAPTYSWLVSDGSTNATAPNQARKIMRNTSDGRLHVVLEKTTSPTACVAYTYSTNRGTNWATTEVVANSAVYQYRASLGLINNVPSVAYLDMTNSIPAAFEADGAVRTGASSWTTGSIWSCGEQGSPYTTSTAMSPSDATNPMAYTVIGWSELDGTPTGYSYVTLVAWDLNSGSIRTLLTTAVDQVYIADSAYDMSPSIAVSGHSGYDTLHICYIYRDGSANRIYYRKNSSALNPSIIRGGGSITWASRLAVSTSGSQPAGEPSMEYYSSGSTRKAVVSWSAGSGNKDIWQSSRTLSYSTFASPWNVSNTTADSRYPESSRGGFYTTWQEWYNSSNWETYVSANGDLYNISSTSTGSEFPHVAHSADTVYFLWTEDVDTTKIYFQRWRYIPSKSSPGGDGQGSLVIELPSSPSRIRVTPNPSDGAPTIAFDVMLPGCSNLEVYTIEGRRVTTIPVRRGPDGLGHALWDGRDRRGALVPSGIYIGKTSARECTVSVPVTLVR